MTASQGQMKCKLYPSAFSGEVVVQVDTATGLYEGIAPKHYVSFNGQLTKGGIEGQVKVHVLSRDKEEVRVRTPDGQVLTVSADKV